MAPNQPIYHPPTTTTTTTTPHSQISAADAKMATATGISPSSSPLGLAGNSGHHASRNSRKPRTSSSNISGSQSARLHTQHATSSRPVESKRASSSYIGTLSQQHHHHQSPHAQLKRQNTNPKAGSSKSKNATSTPTSNTHGDLVGKGHHRVESMEEVIQDSPNYFNLTFNNADTNLNPMHNGFSDASSGAAGSGVGGHVHTRVNWSPPSSRVRSTAALSPRVLPLDQDPQYEAFRRQSDLRSQKAMHSAFGSLGMPSPVADAHMASSRLHNVQSASDDSSDEVTKTSHRTEQSQHLSQLTLDTQDDSVHFAPLEEKSRSPKRTLSSPYANITDRPRRLSPASFNSRDRENTSSSSLKLNLGGDSQASMPFLKMRSAVPSSPRAETLPGVDSRQDSMDTDAHPFASPSHIVTLLDASEEEVLIIDLRVNVQYSRSRIRGALNICIPPLLLKRATYDTKKLATSLEDPEQRSKFEQWRACKYIVVYDANSSKMKDATPCLNMLKKFEAEGWKGGSSNSFLIRGGFQNFAKQFPTYLSYGKTGYSSSGSASGSDVGRNRPAQLGSAGGNGTVPAIVGGCPMPAAVTRTAVNPFFGNIRQNMDLIGGVGQIEVKIPRLMTDKPAIVEDLPRWLRKAVSTEDSGKAIAAEFLSIEKQEQKRMQEALSGTVRYTNDTTSNSTARETSDDESIQLAGIEKGAKNRYNNIWPYEHTRVKLEGRREDDCDYVNANHIHASWSNKRYIATQGPIPATFNDFWSMVWQQDARVIVMLTAESEGGQVKAHNYWNHKHYGSLTLHFLSEHKASLEPAKIRKGRGYTAAAAPLSPLSPKRKATSTPGSAEPATKNSHTQNNPFGFHGLTRKEKKSSETADPSPISSSASEQPYVIVRRFTLSNSHEPFERMREITHLQYSHWPDFGAPAHPAHLLGLVEQCDAVVRSRGVISPNTGAASSGFGSAAMSPSGRSNTEVPVETGSRPVIVHCSAGCGRTGTFCTVDSVLDMVRRQKLRAREAKMMAAAAPISGSKVSLDENGLGIGSPMEVDDASSPIKDQKQSRNNRNVARPLVVATKGSFSSSASGGDSDVHMEDTDTEDKQRHFSINTTISSPPTTVSLSCNASTAAIPTDALSEADWVNNEDVDLIEKTVRDFRLQRLSMVQSLRQYVLCYETVLEWIAEQEEAETQSGVFGK